MKKNDTPEPFRPRRCYHVITHHFIIDQAMTTIVYCHPYDKSFNHNILEAITKQYTALGQEYDVINLYNEEFNPVLDTANLALYSKGETNDEKVRRYQKVLTNTRHIIFMFPIWWGMMPAMLKGFIDKVFLKGIVYDSTPEGALIPCLSIPRTTLITTSEEDSEVIAPFITGYFTPLVLNTVGMNGVNWFNCDHVSSGTDEHRREFIDDVLKKLA